ncbi:MAG: methyltransferase domain-containing protein [Deltaproteobacteria bacterium]|nr:methyltransferase domain-containing protein [Deltaproteobacteria bacterium]
MRRSSTRFSELLACPSCRSALAAEGDARLVCTSCTAAYANDDGIPTLRASADAPTEGVREFYTHSPFPNYPPNESLSGLRRKAERSELARLLDAAIPGDATVLEVGCGTGQMSLFLARADRLVVGADLTRASLLLGREASLRHDVAAVRFVETDLRRPGLRDGAFDVVYSSGVLHHTPDPRASFASITRLVKPGGVVVVGLYNTYARVPHRLRRALSRLTGYRWFPFDPVLRDRSAEPARYEAWLRDQYQHPLEHRCSVGDVQGWFRENGVEYLRCYPSTLVADEPLEGDAFFSPAEDDWSFENVLSQIGWAMNPTIAAEGGLFVAVGRRG